MFPKAKATAKYLLKTYNGEYKSGYIPIKTQTPNRPKVPQYFNLCMLSAVQKYIKRRLHENTSFQECYAKCFRKLELDQQQSVVQSHTTSPLSLGLVLH